MKAVRQVLGDFSVQAATAGILSAFVGTAASFAIVVQGLSAAGASPMQAASGLMALSFALGCCGIYLSLKSRLPISIAWSTPGAALLATTGAPEGGFAAAVGAFLLTGVLIVLAGLWKPLGRWVSAIPTAIAGAMLAGVLLVFCLAPIKAVAEDPWLSLPVIAAWALMFRINRLFAVPAALLVTIIIIALSGQGMPEESVRFWPDPVLVVPAFEIGAIIGIGLPLFLVTMASQNIPGMAVLNANGYQPQAGPLFVTTGVFTLAAAPFGGHAVNLAAITAAMCAGEDAHPDPARRYWAALAAGMGYLVFALLAGLVTALIAASPTYLINAVAGLALLATFGAALTSAVSDVEMREPAVVTFIVTASGLSFFGVGSAFWGLVAGIGMHAILRAWRKRPT